MVINQCKRSSSQPDASPSFGGVGAAALAP